MTADSKKKKPSKKSLDSSFKRPDGMHRELYNLLATDKPDASHPLIPTWNQSRNKLAGYKNPKAKLGLKKARQWKWVPFSNAARQDSLTLCHWRRVDRVDTETEYPFSRFSKTLDVPVYDSARYEKCLEAPGWSREETDHLMDLARRFDLRWVIMEDRWDREKFSTKRTVEDLKERYYNIVNAIKKEEAPGEVEPELVHFDADHERRRKEQLEKLWNRTEEEIEEEETLLRELKRIEMRRKEREKKAHDLQKLITAADRTPQTPQPTGVVKKKAPKQSTARPTAQGVPQLASMSVDLTSAGLKFPEFKGVGPHMRSQEMKINQQVGQKKAKAIDQALDKLGLEHNPLATEDIVREFNELRSDIILLYELKGALTSCEYDLEALRHQYKAMTGKTLDIPNHVRVNAEYADGRSPKRKITNAMEIGAANPVPRKKKVPELNSALRKLRRS